MFSLCAGNAHISDGSHGGVHHREVLTTRVIDLTDAALTFNRRNHRGRSMPVQVRRLRRLPEERKACAQRQRPEGTGRRAPSQSECPLHLGFLIITKRVLVPCISTERNNLPVFVGANNLPLICSR